jgi:Tfp pilus assembly protein PilF
MTSTNGYKDVDEALNIAIQAVEQGDLKNGEAALSWVLKKDPDNTAAWLWLACCAPEERAREECYRRASVLEGYE